MKCVVTSMALSLAISVGFAQQVPRLPFKMTLGEEKAGLLLDPSAAKGNLTAVLSFDPVPLSVSSPLPVGSALEWVDVDSDSDLDFFCFTGSPDGWGPYLITLFENVNGDFTLVTTSGIDATSATAYYLADVDHDNRLDLVYVENRLIKIAFNNGNKTFSIVNTAIELEWNGAQPLYCIDIDGDTDLDIVTRPTADFYAFIPSQQFGSGSSVAYPATFSFLSFANLDNRGVLDFFMTSFGEGYTIQSLSVSQGTTYRTGDSFLNAPHSRVIWADIDLDGDGDMFSLTGYGWKAFRNQAIQTDQAKLEEAATFSASTLAAAAGDLNSDGKPDFVQFDGAAINVYLNESTNEDFQFTLDHSIPATDYSRIYLLDIDGQAGLDIVTNTTVYKNALSQLSDPPSIPTGLSCQYYGSNLRLFWDTPNKALHYRYEVYKSGELIASSGSADDGRLLQLTRTPIIHTAPVLISPWPAGKYSFRVQAIDASFRSSAFSELKELDEIPVGIEESSGFNVFPNPTTDNVTITLPKKGSVHIRDPFSGIVFFQEVDNPSGSSIELSTLDWATGLYIVHFEFPEGRYVRKLVVTR